MIALTYENSTIIQRTNRSLLQDYAGPIRSQLSSLLGTVGRSAGLDGLLPQLEEVGQVALLSLLLVAEQSGIDQTLGVQLLQLSLCLVLFRHLRHCPKVESIPAVVFLLGFVSNSPKLLLCKAVSLDLLNLLLALQLLGNSEIDLRPF